MNVLNFRERSGPVETLYFFYSFGFLVLRTITVSMYGAWLYDATKKPLRYLCSVPSEYYCNEVIILNFTLRKLLNFICYRLIDLFSKLLPLESEFPVPGFSF